MHTSGVTMATIHSTSVLSGIKALLRLAVYPKHIIFDHKHTIFDPRRKTVYTSTNQGEEATLPAMQM